MVAVLTVWAEDDLDVSIPDVPRRNHNVDDAGRMVTVRRTRWKRRVFIV